MDDLLGKEKSETTLSTNNTTPSSSSSIKNVLIKSQNNIENEDIAFKNETEWIESDGKGSEDDKFEKKIEGEMKRESQLAENLPPGHVLTGIMIGAVVLVSLFGYLVLMMWRRFLE